MSIIFEVRSVFNTTSHSLTFMDEDISVFAEEIMQYITAPTTIRICAYIKFVGENFPRTIETAEFVVPLHASRTANIPFVVERIMSIVDYMRKRDVSWSTFIAKKKIDI